MSSHQDGFDTISLFDMGDDCIGGSASGAKLDVVKLNYDSAESVTWQELFEGFNTLRAITFSSGVNFVYKLLGMFDSSEIIFGCEAVMSYTLQEVMAYQDKLIERMRDTASNAKLNLLTRIDNGSVRFFVSRTQLSHEKLYLLAADDGRKRVIMGSANMSYNAFGGVQRENICYIDGDNAYDWYLNTFMELKENSTDEIKRSALDKADLAENINELPIAGTIKANKVLVIEPVKENSEEVQFILDTHKFAEALTPMLPKADRKTGKLMVVSDTIVKLRRQLINETVKEKELRSEYPQLVIDAFHGAASLNGEPLNLSPDSESIAEDVALFLKYMDGYSKFHGDYIGMQYRYFEFANWFFCSPFMGVMRDMAARYDQNKLPYPVFGLVYGQSKAGKTSFLETLLKMMIGQKPKVSAPDFTRSSIENLKRTVKGAPIIVDDLTNTRFNQHAIETIKTMTLEPASIYSTTPQSSSARMRM